MANEKRLIDANELEAHFHETKMIEIFPYWKELSFDTQCELVRFGKALKKMMQNAPTVDAVEVVHGAWMDFADSFEKRRGRMDLRCSVCRNRASKFVYGSEDWWDGCKPNYCPHCGAKMDGDGNG